MAESDHSGVRRTEVIERRLEALQDLGLDVAALRTQLGKARSYLEQGQGDEAQALCDEVVDAARRLAAGASRSSGDWRGLPKTQLLEELRRALGEGAVNDLMVERERVLGDEFETRQREFERRLRDQFARELAQVISARPWLKDLSHAEPAGDQALAKLRSEVDELRAASPTTAHQLRELIAKAQNSGTGQAASGFESGVVNALHREVEGIRSELLAAPSMAQLNGLITKLVNAKGLAKGTEEDLRDLAAEGSSLHAWLGERLLRLEAQLVAVVTPHLVDKAAAPVKDPTMETVWPLLSDDDTPLPEGGNRGKSARKTPLSSAAAAKGDVGDNSRGGTLPSPAQPTQEALTAASVSSSPAPALDEGLIRRLIDERLATLRGQAGDELLPDDDDEEEGRQLIRVLPKVMQNPQVRSALFAAFALEATAHPGALAELSGLRAFLRKELNLAIDGLRREMGAAV